MNMKEKHANIKNKKPAMPLKREPTQIGKGPTKTFQQDGHWIVKTTKTVVHVCTCGNRYLKTRPGQTKCLRCMAYISPR